MLKNTVLKYLILILFFVFIIRQYYNYKNTYDNLNSITFHVQKSILNKENEIYSILQDFVSKYKQKKSLLAFDELSKKEVFLYIIQNEKLVYWNSNIINPLLINSKNFNSPRIVAIKNGIYEQFILKSNNINYIAFLPIYYRYPYENKFFENGFSLFLKPLKNEVSPILTKNKNAIFSRSGSYLFSVAPNKNTQAIYPTIICYLDFILLMLLLSILYFIVLYIKISNYLKVTLYTIILLLVRVFMLYFKWPSSFYSLNIFNPHDFGSSNLFSSLGDVFLHFLFYIIWFLFIIKHLSNKYINYLVVFICVFFIFSNTYLTSVLIRDSQLNFDLNNVAQLDLTAFLALLVIVVSYTINFLLIITCLNVVSKKTFLWALLSAMVLSVFFYYNFNILWYWYILSFCGIVFLPLNKWYFKFNSVFALLIGFVFTVILTVCLLSKLLATKEIDYRKNISEKLVEEQDLIAENLFSTLITPIQNDSVIKSLLLYKNTNGDLKKYLYQKYFNGYWDKYTLQPNLFNASGEVVLKESISDVKDISIYEDELKIRNNYSNNNMFAYISKQNQQHYYIGKIIFYNEKNKLGTLYLTLQNKFISEDIAFTDLILENNYNLLGNLHSYSYAKYKGKTLVNKSGTYNYPLKSNIFEKIQSANYTFDFELYSHYIVSKNADYLIVLSKEITHYTKYISIIIYFLLMFLGVFSIFWFLINYKSFFSFIEPSFRLRIQFLFFAVLIGITAIFSYATITIVQNQYLLKNKSLINEKINSVLISLEQSFGKEVNLNAANKEYINYSLSQLSKVFYTDINLYDTQGYLVASSKPKLFELGVLSNLINAKANELLIQQKKTAFTQFEDLGNLNFLSSYLPFENNYNQVLGYINLPYFAKQSEYKKELSNYVITIINMFLLLFIASILITYLFANRLTRPLVQVQERLSKLQLNKQNEHINYTGKDEIGKLIYEYNRMVDELGNSTNKLVQSEREGAWKEMAKQVAHEIKNPLTPIKLSVQHLQRTFKGNKEDINWNNLFEKTTHNIIEQIDTLSNIATEFSSFAKLPTANYIQVDVYTIIKQIVELSDNDLNNDLKINFILFNKANNTIVLGDKDYLKRIFLNLIQNAIQAINEIGKLDGKITINLSNKNLTTIFIEIKDNGNGIPNDVQEKIFTPYFTTKSTGTGLGLAMVKKMVEQMKGQISFVSNKQNGTVFEIYLPNI